MVKVRSVFVHGFNPCRSNTVVFRRLLTVKLAAPKNESRFAARVSKEDFENFKSISEKKGIGYQTLLGSIIHLYVIGQLVDVDEIKKVSPQIKIKL